MWIRGRVVNGRIELEYRCELLEGATVNIQVEEAEDAYRLSAEEAAEIREAQGEQRSVEGEFDLHSVF